MTKRDMNRDPITKAPGSHPVGTALGGSSGGVAGMIAGAPFGPIGMLVGGGVGVIAGAAAGHGIAESIDPTGEVEYWKDEHVNRPYYNGARNFETDYRPAYLYGVNERNRQRDTDWNSDVAKDLQSGWQKNASGSSLDWSEAEPAVRDAWDRVGRSYNAYLASDREFDRYNASAPAQDTSYSPSDYRSAYRYGTYARSMYPEDSWDNVESRLERNWDRARGESSMAWSKAKDTAKRAWHAAERLMPGDADNDGR